MGRVEDVARRPVILLQLDDLRVLEILFEFQDVPDIGAAPLVYALVVVADDADVVSLDSLFVLCLCEHLDELVLSLVRVLVLVDHDVLEAPLILEEDRFILLKKLHGLEQQIVEVHGVVLAQSLVVQIVDLRDHAAVHLVAVDALVLLRRAPLFLAVADAAEEIVLVELLRVDVQLFARVLDDRLLVRRIVNGKIPAVADGVGVTSQDSQACRVECQDPHIDARSDECLHPVAHLLGRLVGEGDRQNVVRVHAHFPDQICDPAGHGAGLAASGSRQNEQRPLGMHRSFPLLIV